MIKNKNSKKIKAFSIIALLLALLVALAGCDFILDMLNDLINQDIPFDPKTRGDSITSTIFETHLDSIPEEDRTDELPVDSFKVTVDMTNEPSDYNSSASVNVSLRKLTDTVVAGKRPIVSADPENPVTKIYNAARDVLNEFIHDDFSEYEIVHTIYDWIAFYVDYDHALLETYYDSAGSLNPNDPAFHLSGVFLSGLAVCDGISKAFSLLCAMEGLKTERVLGWYYGNGQYVGHAWNKVKIKIDEHAEADEQTPTVSADQDADENGRYWFFVDPTFASVAIAKNGKITEYVSHAYLLLTDEQSKDHFQDDEYIAINELKDILKKPSKSAETALAGANQGGGGIVYSACTKEFDIFSLKTNDNNLFPTKSISIDNLRNYLLNVALPNKIEGVEVRLDVGVTASNENQIKIKINTALNSLQGIEDAWWTYCGKDNNILMLVLVY